MSNPIDHNEYHARDLKTVRTIVFEAGWQAAHDFYAAAIEAERARIWDDGFQACVEQINKQTLNPDHVLTRDNPHRGRR